MEYAGAAGQDGIAATRTADGGGALGAASLALALTVVVMAASLFTRALWPALDGAPLAAAWDMWRQGQFLVPVANGAFAPQAPLLPWSIHAGWALAGVNEGWPRMVPAVFMLLTLAPTARLARVFWPGERAAARCAPVMLVGTGGWLAATTVVAPAMLLAFAVALGQLALFVAGRHRDGRAWLLLGLALGLGLLVAGAAVLLYLLPAAVLAPLWVARKPQPIWSHWYGDLLKAAALGSALFLAWFMPAAVAAPAPLAAWWPLLSLTSSVRLPTGAVPFALLVLALCVPWVASPQVWTRLWSVRRRPLATPVRFVLCTWVPALAALAWLAPTQPLALLPLLPSAAALVAGLAVAVAGLRPARVAAASALLIALAVAVGGWQFNRTHDLSSLARNLAVAQQGGRSLAVMGDYRGEYQFLARLRAPLPPVAPAQATMWLADHPGGWLVADAHWRPSVPAREVALGKPAAVRIWQAERAGNDFVPGGASP